MKKKIIIAIIIILICFIVGIMLGHNIGNLLMEYEKEPKITDNVDIGIDKSDIYISDIIANGEKTEENECICGVIVAIYENNIIQLSELYGFRGGQRFKCEEYTSAFVKIGDNTSFVDYKTLKKIEDDYNIKGKIAIFNGKLVKDEDDKIFKNSKLMLADESEIKVIDDIFFWNILNDIINNKKEISNVELCGINNIEENTNEIACKYTVEDNGYKFPCIFYIKVTDDTIFQNVKDKKYDIGKKVNMTFSDTIESIEVEFPIAKTIEYIDD